MGKKKSLASWLGTAGFTVLCLAWIAPIIIVLYDSYKKRAFISLEPFKLPTAETFAEFENYITAIDRYGFMDAVGWTVFITVGSVAAILVCTSMCACSSPA